MTTIRSAIHMCIAGEPTLKTAKEDEIVTAFHQFIVSWLTDQVSPRALQLSDVASASPFRPGSIRPFTHGAYNMQHQCIISPLIPAGQIKHSISRWKGDHGPKAPRPSEGMLMAAIKEKAIQLRVWCGLPPT